MVDVIKIRRNSTTAGANASVVVPALGEPLANLQTGEIRVGDGANTWVNLPSAASSSTGLSVDVTKAPYKADRTGAVDATTAINQAITDVSAAGGGRVTAPNGSVFLVLGVQLKSNVYLDMPGVTMNKNGGGAATHLIEALGALTATTQSLTVDATQGQTNLADPCVVNVAATPVFAAGDYVVLRDGQYKYLTGLTGRNQEINRVQSVFPVRTVSDGAMTAASAVLTSATAVFALTDVGKSVTVTGAGAAGATLSALVISYINPTAVTLATAATTTVSGSTVAVSAAVTLRRRPLGSYLVSQTAELVKVNVIADARVTVGKLIGTGTTPAGGGFYGIYCYRVIIRETAAYYPSDNSGFRFDSSAFCHIIDCSVYDGLNLLAGGYGYGATLVEACHHCSIRGGHYENIRECSLTNNARYCQMLYMTVVGSADAALNTHGSGNEHCLIANNTITASRGSGITVGFSTHTAADTDISIQNNDITGCGGAAISVSAPVGKENRRILLSGNRIRGYGFNGAGYPGILLSNSIGVMVSDNDVSGNTPGAARGIQATVCTSIKIQGNTVADLSNGYGIVWNSTVNLSVEGNTIENVSSYNFYSTDSLSTGVLVRNNRADDSLILLSGTETAYGNELGTLGSAASSWTATMATKVNKGDLVLNAKDYGITTTGDQTAAIQAFFTGLANGSEVIFPAGTYTFSTVTLAKNNVTLTLQQGAVLNKTGATSDGLVISGSGCKVVGGSIVSPGTWDGTNVQPTYAVVHVTGLGVIIDSVQLTNVPKVGVYIDETGDARVEGCTITGNYPAGSYTGVETGHFGIAINPSPTAGRNVVTRNILRSCVQGVFIGNYGASSVGAYGTAIANNIFDGCHNHGIYCAGGVDGLAISGNTFTRCAGAVAATGSAHAITGNTIYTDATGNNLDQPGISLRSPLGCTVSNNTIKGDAPVGGTIIDLTNTSAGGTIANNTITGNTVVVSGGSSNLIRVGNSSNTSVLTDNVVTGNVLKGTGRSGGGVLLVSAAAAATTYGNKVTGNDVVVTGESHGIAVLTATHVTVSDNSVRFEYDAPSATTLACIYVSAASYCVITDNDLYNLAAWGTNVSLRGIWEIGASSSKNRYVHNQYFGDLTKLVSFTRLVLITNSDSYLNERGPGSPTGSFYGAPGSRWSRDDGSAGTSLYIKESANTSATWVALAASDTTKVSKGDLVINVRDYGATGDGTTDDSAAILAAATAAGAGGQVIFPKGNYRWNLTTGITVPSYQTWQGMGESNSLGSGAVSQIYFPNLAAGNTAVSAGTSCIFERLFFRGPGAGVTGSIGLSNGGLTNARISVAYCQFYEFAIGSLLTASYYSSFDHCEWRHNDTGLQLASVCYNVNIVAPRFDGANGFSTYGTCILVDAVQNLNIYGGSIESYGAQSDTVSHAGVRVTSTSTRCNISLFGIYMETAAVGGTGVNLTSTVNANLKVFGGEIQLGNHEGWLYFPLATNGSILVRGVTFMGSSTNFAAACAYLGSSGVNRSATAIAVDVAGDVWAVTGMASATYDNGLGATRWANVSVAYPATGTGPGSSSSKGNLFLGSNLVVPQLGWVKTGSGITSARPAASTAGAGAAWYDTTLSAPVWSDGTNWIGSVTKGELAVDVKDYGAKGDGATDDTTAIQAAITAAALTGQWVTLNGNHKISNELLLSSGSKINGQQGTLTQITNLKAAFRLTNVVGVLIRDVVATGKTTDYVNTSGVYPARAVYVEGTTSDVRIESCSFLGWAGAGVYLSATSSDVHVVGCRLTGAGATYILNNTYNYGAGIATETGATKWEVHRCDISAFAQGIATGDNMNDIRVTNNYIHDIPGQHAMYLETINNGVIAHNVVRNTGLLGVKIQVGAVGVNDADTVTISDNVFTNVGAQGILLTNPVGGATRLRRISVTGNVINTAVGKAIEANNCVGLHVADNTIFNANQGISVSNCSQFDLSDNRMTTLVQNGITITDCQDGVFDSNRVIDAGSANTSTAEFGVAVLGSTSADLTFRDNKITDSLGNMRYGIYISAGDQTTMDFLRNFSSGASDYGLRMITSTTARSYQGNIFTGTLGAATLPPTNFPTGDGTPQIDVYATAGSYTWTKPAGAKLVKVFLTGSGGGGASGRRGAPGTVRCGGGGGAAGSQLQTEFDAADLTATVTVVVGAAGTGGAAVTVDDTNGNPGTTGNYTYFGSGSTTAYGCCYPASGGLGGTATTGTGGTGGFGIIPGGNGASASTTGGVGTAVTVVGGCQGGGSGGGITTANVAGNGGAGRQSMSVGGGALAAGVVDTTLPVTPTVIATKNTPGPGPGGGAASITTTAQSGLTPPGYGGGGSAGGASTNGFNSGAGGNGAPGYAMIITYFS